MTKLMLYRVRIIFVIVIGIFLLLSGRLAYLQILQHDYYWHHAERNRFTRITLAAPRGEIYDRQGNLMVTNRPGFVVSLMDMGDGYDPETIAFLSDILEMDEEDIYSAIQGQLYMRYLPLRLKSDIAFETIAQISEHRWKLRGVNIEVRPIRDYREHLTAAHVLGHLSLSPPKEETALQWAEDGYNYRAGDLVGQDGLERIWEAWLRGKDGEQRIETNTLGQAINYFERRDPVPGHNLYLTLDLDLQRVVEEALDRRIQQLIEEENEYAGRAAAVIMDPHSGAILAMASYPSFDPNLVGVDDQVRQWTNNSIMKTYPIGSTYKMVTGTAVLEEGKFSDRDIIRCGGVAHLVGDTKRCFDSIAHGSVNFYDAMAVSCNIFFYRAGLAAGIDSLEHYAREYGFGSPTGLKDIPGEEHGVVPSRERFLELTGDEWQKGSTMSVAIGQEDNRMTPLQLANYAAIIANGGLHYRPYLVQAVTDWQGEVIQESAPELLRQAQISEETLAMVREGMWRVGQPRGTAWHLFRRLPVAVAGKTGSAEVPGRPAHSLFVGYAPYENPEIAIAVIVEHGGTGATGAVPVSTDILEYYFTGTIKGVYDNQ